jgi:hypothetical protein
MNVRTDCQGVTVSSCIVTDDTANDGGGIDNNATATITGSRL